LKRLCGQHRLPAEFDELPEHLKMPGVYGLEINHKLKKIALKIEGNYISKAIYIFNTKRRETQA
jgi:hypothetical protein